MDRGDQDCQSCLAKLVGAQVEEEAVHSHEEGTDFAAAGTVDDSEQAEKEVATQAIDKGTPLDYRDRKKAMHPWQLDAGD